jgi:hypothetical protein
MDHPFRIYFETSAVNELSRVLSRESASRLRLDLAKNNVYWHISPIVLWELMLTRDQLVREHVIVIGQHLFAPILLPSPEELIVTYIKSGCPVVEPFYNLESCGEFAYHWKETCSVKEKTIGCDITQLKKRTDALRSLTRTYILFHRSVEAPTREDAAKSKQSFTDPMPVIDAYRLRRGDESEEETKHLCLVVLLILSVLCTGITVDSEAIEKFWEDIGISSIIDRIDYLFSKFPQLAWRGPFQHIAFMIDCQSKVNPKKKRGAFFDSLHGIYSIYADMVVSADNDFISFRDRLLEIHPHARNIVSFDEFMDAFRGRGGSEGCT